MFVCCKCCVLSGRGFYDELVTRPEESYRLWCVVLCGLENLMNEEAMTHVGSQHHTKKKQVPNSDPMFHLIFLGVVKSTRASFAILYKGCLFRVGFFVILCVAVAP